MAEGQARHEHQRQPGDLEHDQQNPAQRLAVKRKRLDDQRRQGQEQKRQTAGGQVNQSPGRWP